ncbi:MAG: DUF169 domain-containing protein [Actinomycetota bacterium]|nr:DUF169 domain-containing protein [Actinomycetota bacterium]
MEKEWRDQLKQLVEVLGIESEPVAVTFTNDEVDVGERERMWMCRAVKLAARGRTLVIDAETSACPGGTWHCGLAEPPSGDMRRSIQWFLTRGEKLTHSIATFQRMMDQTVPPPTGFCERIVMGPVAQADLRPDIVLFLCNAEQACRLTTLDQYWDGIPPRMEVAGSMCHSALVYPAITGRSNLSLGDWTARRMQKYPAEIVFVSIPFERVPNLVSAVPECSAGSAGLDTPEEIRRSMEEG